MLEEIKDNIDDYLKLERDIEKCMNVKSYLVVAENREELYEYINNII